MTTAPVHAAPEVSPRGAMARAALVIASFTALAWWAFAPMPAVNIDPSPRPAPVQSPAAQPVQLALDLAPFHAPLWMAPPAPPPPTPAPKPEPAPPPLKLQILAIVRDGDGDRALLYDPDTDKPIWVRAGQPVGSRTVENVTADAVEIRDGKLLRTLALRETKPALSALERALRGPGDLR